MVRYCPMTDCPLWYLRLGRMPQTIINQGRAEEKELFNPENFKEGARFDPSKDMSSLRIKKHEHL